MLTTHTKILLFASTESLRHYYGYRQTVFKDIEIDRRVIQSLPKNGVPDELRYVIDDNEPSVHLENEVPP